MRLITTFLISALSGIVTENAGPLCWATRELCDKSTHGSCC